MMARTYLLDIVEIYWRRCGEITGLGLAGKVEPVKHVPEEDNELNSVIVTDRTC